MCPEVETVMWHLWAAIIQLSTVNEYIALHEQMTGVLKAKNAG